MKDLIQVVKQQQNFAFAVIIPIDSSEQVFPDGDASEFTVKMVIANMAYLSNKLDNNVNC